MAKQYFVLGIGGTGMRCIESLIHMCAMGMFDGTDIHLLALDTDKNNGNFGRLKELKEAYVNAKGLNAESRVAHKEHSFQLISNTTNSHLIMRQRVLLRKYSIMVILNTIIGKKQIWLIWS